MDTGKNRIVGKNTKRALKSTLFAVLLSASLSLEGLAAMTADGPGAAYEFARETAENTASEEYTNAVGAGNRVSGYASSAFGNNNEVTAEFASAFGQQQ